MQNDDLPATLGWRQRHMLSFCRKYPGRHTISHDAKTQQVALSLAKRGLLHVTDCGMCSATGRTVYMVSST